MQEEKEKEEKCSISLLRDEIILCYTAWETSLEAQRLGFIYCQNRSSQIYLARSTRLHPRSQKQRTEIAEISSVVQEGILETKKKSSEIDTNPDTENKGMKSTSTIEEDPTVLSSQTAAEEKKGKLTPPSWKTMDICVTPDRRMVRYPAAILSESGLSNTEKDPDTFVFYLSYFQTLSCMTHMNACKLEQRKIEIRLPTDASKSGSLIVNASVDKESLPESLSKLVSSQELPFTVGEDGENFSEVFLVSFPRHSFSRVYDSSLNSYRYIRVFNVLSRGSIHYKVVGLCWYVRNE